MDELLKALVGLVNTGGALADDALYLYFGLKLLGSLTWVGALLVVARTVLALQRTYMDKHRGNLELELKAQLVGYWKSNPGTFGRDPWRRESETEQAIAQSLAKEAQK